MLQAEGAFSGFSVDDLDTAKRFYEQTLGLSVDDQHVDQGLITLKVGNGPGIFIYAKDSHQPATYTVLNFAVDDVEREVDELTERGVKFERYEGFEQDERGICRDDDMPTIAWFTDPAKNVFAVIENSPPFVD